MTIGPPGRTQAQEARSRSGRRAQARGLAAEGRVCQALEHDGWTVLDRRARTKAGEIDIVARRDDAAAPLIAFIEVKARRQFSEAAAALSARQRHRLAAAAAIVLADHPEWSDCGFRFDVVLVDAAGRVRRLADAFRIGDE